LEQFRAAVDDRSLKVSVVRQDMSFMLLTFKEGKDAVALAWTNKQVNFLNSQIRSYLFANQISLDEPLKKYYKGESLIFTGYRPRNDYTY